MLSRLQPPVLQKDQPLQYKIVGLSNNTDYFYRIWYRVVGNNNFSAADEANFPHNAVGERSVLPLMRPAF